MTVGLNVLLTYWNRNFINALENYDRSGFLRSILYFAFLAAAIIIVSVHKSYFMQSYQLRWRRWLTSDFLSRYLSHHAYYQISLSSNNDQTMNNPNDNPDQRISMDINNYVETILTLAMNFLNAFASLVSYIIVLWPLSGVIQINITQNWSLEIRGLLVWAALIYAGFGTFFTNFIGRILFYLKYEQEHREADFRYALVHLRDHAESVAFYRSESIEKVSLSATYLELILNFERIIRRRLALNSFDSFYRTVAIIFPFIVASPQYFAKMISLGALAQISMAFENVHKSLSFIPNSYEIIVQWRSATKRLIEFDHTLNQLSIAKQNSQIKLIYIPEERSIHIQELTVRLPVKTGENDGKILINNFNIVLEPHQAVLITGISGSGKSTLLRTLAGIWPHGSGTIIFPLGDTVAFLPQKAYCPHGSLRQCLMYPSTLSSPEDDKNIKQLLSLCQMNYWSNRLDEVQDWSRVFSLGEQQKLALIRILLLRPKWLFLDEATSSLDEQAETFFYLLLAEQLANHSTIISIGHRNNLRQFHQIELILDNQYITVKQLALRDKIKATLF